jgi:hypothetical protein
MKNLRCGPESDLRHVVDISSDNPAKQPTLSTVKNDSPPMASALSLPIQCQLFPYV